MTPMTPDNGLPTLDFSKEQTAVLKIIGEHEEEVTKCRLRQDLRRFDVNTAEKRAKKEIGEADHFIPIRAIDSAIQRLKPSQVAFLEQSRRLLIFKDLKDPTIPCEDLEIAF